MNKNYFSHDTNAGRDPKVLQMMSIYGPAGYGMFWLLIEAMAEQPDYKLSIGNKYDYQALAIQARTEPETIKQFIADCISEFTDGAGLGLFASDGKAIWSESLNRRMAIRAEKVEQMKAAAKARWEQERKSKRSKPNKSYNNKLNASIANAMQEQCISIESPDIQPETATQKKAYFENEAVNNAFILYLEYRKAKGRELTPKKGLPVMIKKLNTDFPKDQEKIDAMERSIINGWNDVFKKSEQPTIKLLQKGNFAGRGPDDEETKKALDNLAKN